MKNLHCSKAKLTKTEPETKILEIDELDLAVIIYTSGTTGQSKGVMLSHRNLISQLFQVEKLISLNEKDRFLSILPLAHTFESSVGFLVPIYSGAAILLP